MGVADYETIIQTAVSDTSSATIAALKNTAILVAPGAGLRYRMYGVALAWNIAAGTPAAGSLLTGQVSGSGWAQMTISTGTGSTYLFVPQGVPLGTNTALGLNTWGSAASLAFRVGVLYTTETV